MSLFSKSTRKSDRRNAMLVLTVTLVLNLSTAFGAEHGKPSHHLSSSHHAHAMPQAISNFNSSAQFAATNLLNSAARAAFQTEVNNLASRYNGLMRDARSGSYDTSQMGGLMNGFANTVDAVKMPEEQKRTAPPQEDNAGKTTGESIAANSEINIVLQVKQNSEAPTSPNRELAAANEQIIPDLQSALSADQGKVTSSQTVPTNPRASDSSGHTENGVLIVAIAASGTLPAGTLAATDNADREGSARVTNLDGGKFYNEPLSDGVDSPSDANLESQTDASLPSGPYSENFRSNGLEKSTPAPHALSDHARSVVTVRPRTLVRHENEDSKGQGVFRALKKMVFGPRLSSFFRPLDLSQNQDEDSDTDKWWQNLFLPIFFTIVFSGIALLQHSRLARNSVKDSARSNGALTFDSSNEDEPPTSAVTLPKFRRHQDRT